MSLIAICMNALLACLLLAAMVVGLRLNRRLKALKDSHAGFEVAVRELNLAAVRAEQGLADLRAATDEATDMLSDRIEKGRALAAKLERLVQNAPEVPAAPARAPRPAMAQTSMPSMRAPQPQPRSQAEANAAALEAAQAALAALRSNSGDETAERRLGALLAAAREARHRPETLVSREPRVARDPMTNRPSLSPDDDLFEDVPAVDRFAGAHR